MSIKEDEFCALEGAWRPFEPSADEAKRIEKEREANTCNLHSDCAAADEMIRAAGGRMRAGERVMYATHCSVEDCEDCFGC